VLTDRDQEILKVIHFYRYMTARDIALRLFSESSLTYVRSILSKMAGNKDREPNQFLYRFGLPKAQKGNVERIFSLGARGKGVLVNNMGIPVNWYFRPGRMTNYSYNFIVHSLVITRFLVAAHAWSKSQDAYKLIDTRISYELASQQLIKNSTTDNGVQRPEIIPDGWLLFQNREQKRGGFLLEIDRGTEYQERFKRHIASRLEFVKSGAYEQMFGERSVTVVYVAVGDLPYRETRRRTMLLWTREVLEELELENWGSMFKFCDVGLDVYGANLFEDEVWYSTESSKAGKLFPN
jgi:hypothetical protein